MKRFFYYTIICCAALAIGSCSQSEEMESLKQGSDYIRITTSMSDVKVTRAEDSSSERTVEHIDIFVVGKGGADEGKVVYYERNTSGNDSAAADGAGTLTLKIKRGDSKFSVDAKYAIYLVANSSITTSQAEAMTTYDDLVNWVQSDALLHLSATNVREDAPNSFLMQAVAGSADGQVINSSAGNSVNLDLAATFERAAAKVIVNIKQGDGVAFYKQLSDGSTVGNALYYFNMLPSKSYVLPTKSLAVIEQELITTTDLGPNNSTFVWSEAAGHTADAPNYNLTLVGYAYAHNWSAAEPLNETCLIVNIPIKWDKDGDAANGKEVVACDSWYMIPLSQSESFERNTCYVVNVTINTGGASDRTSVVELDGVEIKTLPWQDVNISVGATGNDPKYLTLNKNLVKIYNADVDASQLTFSSSSPIQSITLKSAYLINKYNNKVNLATNITSRISAQAAASALSGNITITSPLTHTNGTENHSNTVRYLEFEVVNQDGVKATFTVEQYPVIYITNEVGWYSYRDDFVTTQDPNATTYEAKNSGRVKVGVESYNSSTKTVTYRYGTSSSTSGFFWGSKVNTSRENPISGRNYYNIVYYYWNNNTVRTSGSGSSSLGNARMYHVRVTATSTDYTIGRPKMVKMEGGVEVETTDVQNGYTESSEANAKLVSPSFMIASQLGYFEVSTFGSVNNAAKPIVARDHCQNYVEVKNDGTVYDDWRLPTEAEINIILNLQSSGTSDDSKAIDNVLSAGSYFAASGEVDNPSASGSVAVRCIRDAY